MSATDVSSQQDALTGVSSSPGSAVSHFSNAPGQNLTESSPDSMSLATVTALTRFYGCIGIACFVFGVILNAVVFRYFYNRRKTLSNTLYCVIVIVDLLVSVLMLPYILPHFSKTRAPLLFSSQGFCKFWTVVWGATSKITVVLVVVLGICRTVLLLSPFNTTIKGLKRRFVLGGLSLYFLLLVTCETVPLWQDYHWYFEQYRMRCEWRAVWCDEKCERVRIFGYTWNTLTLAVPVLPMLVSAVLSVYGLKRGDRSDDQGKNYASMTIVLFTVLYVVLNIPTLVYWIMMLAHRSSGYTTSLLKFDHPYYFYSNFVEVISVALNSLLNPVLYLCRMRELRKSLSSQIKCKVWIGRSQSPFNQHHQRTNDPGNSAPIGNQIQSQSDNLTSNPQGITKSSVCANSSVVQGKGDNDISMVNMENIYS